MNRNISVIAKVSKNMCFKINNIMIWTRYYVIKGRPTETAEHVIRPDNVVDDDNC